jgi:GNAT superfamily N-acetyltransferase
VPTYGLVMPTRSGRFFSEVTLIVRSFTAYGRSMRPVQATLPNCALASRVSRAPVLSTLSRCSALVSEADGGLVIGFAVLRLSEDADADPSTGELDLIYTAPSVWGRGVGRALMGAALEHLRAAVHVPRGTRRGTEGPQRLTRHHSHARLNGAAAAPRPARGS